LSKTSELIPNSFQVPNLLVDRLLPFLSGPQTKVVLLVCRKTFGWSKRVDLISLGQFEQQAGLSRSSVYEALETFVRAGLLLKTSRGRQQVNGWSLNLEVNAEDVIRFLEESSRAVKKPIYIAQRTSSDGELVLTANQNYIAQRTTTSSPGEPTETQETHKPNVERQGKWDLPVEEAWRYYCQTTGRGPQYEFTRQRRALGVEGLRKAARHAAGMGSQRPEEDALSLLKLAIDRMMVDSWHNGEESGTKYLGWEQLFTSTRFKGNKLVEYWLNEDNAAKKWGAA
jgi:Bacteriophage replication protein O